MWATVTAAPLNSQKDVLELSFTMPSTDFSNVLPILVIDESGSMAGSIYSAVNGAKILMKDYLQGNCPKVIVIRYHTVATSFTFSTIEEVERFTAHSQGMTNFPAAIEQILLAIAEANKANLQARVYFMTDGCNTIDGNLLEGSISKLSAALRGAKISATIDVIGFAHYHDVRLLNNIASSTGEGTFQYAENSDALEEIISDLSAVSGNKRIVNIGWGGQNIRTTAVRDDSGAFYVLKEIGHINSTEVKIHVTGHEPLYLPVIKKELSPETRQRFQIQHIRDTLKDLSQRVTQLRSAEERAAFDTELREIDTQIDTMAGSGDIFRDLTREERRHVRRTHLEFKDLVSQLYKARSTNLSTTEHATLLTSASAHITKTGLQKKLQQRVLANMSNDDSTVAKELGQKLQFPNPPVDNSNCMLTLEGYQDLAQMGDCLCIAMSLSRNQTAIADPSQISISHIQPTFLSLDAFKDVVDLKLTENVDIHNFSVKKTMPVLQGMAREQINAVFPLYFDDASWSVTKLRLREALSWIATMTWQGWVYSQTDLVPLIILAHALKEYYDKPTEFNATILSRIARTCQAIGEFRNGDSFLAETQQKRLQDFMTAPSNRTVDIVPSISALVATAYLYSLGTIFKDRVFIEAVWEEQLRRNLRTQLRSISKDELYSKIAGKLHIDLAKYTTITVSSSGGVQAQMILDALGMTDLQQEIVKENTYQNDSRWDWSVDDILPGDITQATTQWVEICQWFGSETKPVPPKAICLAATVQNMLQAANSDRREAIEKGLYKNPQNYQEIIQGAGERVIKYFREQAWAKYQAARGACNAEEFAHTENLFQAAGFVKQFRHVCEHDLPRFALALAQPSATHLVEKINMLTTGKFKYNDKTVQLLNFGWGDLNGPRRKIVHRWWLGHRSRLTTEEIQQWNSTLPKYTIGGYWDEEWKKVEEARNRAV